MSRKLNLRKQLGKQQYNLIQERNFLLTYFDCDLVYGSNTLNEEEYKQQLQELNKKINDLKLLRNILKTNSNGKENT